MKLISLLICLLLLGQDQIGDDLRRIAGEVEQQATERDPAKVRDLAGQLATVADNIPIYDESHDPGSLHGLPDFALNPTRFTTIGCTPEDVVRIGRANSECISEPTTCAVLGVHGKLCVSSTLDVGTLQVYHDGELTLEPGCRLILGGREFDFTQDPQQWGNGLIVFGKLRANGTRKTHYARVLDIDAGAVAITVIGGVPADWLVGDELVLPRCRENHPRVQGDPLLSNEARKWVRFYAESERATIAAIDGETITLAEPTKWEHDGAIDRDGNCPAHVVIANLTRDIVIESKDPRGMRLDDPATPESEYYRSTRAHIVFLTHADIHAQNVWVKNCGRTTIDKIDNTIINTHDGNYIGTNQIGRYPWHAHHLYGPMDGVDGGEYQSISDDIVIDGGDGMNRQKWGVSYHRGGWHLFKNSVIYNFAGGGIVEEDGCERSNTYENNFVCASWSRTLFKDPAGKFLSPEREGPDPTRDSDSRGTGACAFWFARTYDVRCQNNICADINRGTNDNWNPDGASSVYWVSDDTLHSKLMPAFRGQDPAEWVDMSRVPLIPPHWKIEGGESFGGSRDMNNVSGLQKIGTVCSVTDYTSWNIPSGLVDYWLGIEADRVRIFGNPYLMRGESGVNHTRGRPSNYRNIRIDNMSIGVNARIGRGALGALFENIDSACDTDILINPLSRGVPGYVATFRNCKFSPSSTLHLGWVGATKPAKRGLVNWSTPKPELLNVNLQQIFFENLDGVNSYQAFASYQAPDYVIPDNSEMRALGIAGLTNQQAWDQKGLALGGELAPCATVLDGTTGAFFCEEGD